MVRAGRIVELLASRSEVERAASNSGAEILDLGAVVLAPGFVNAHAHLELSDLRGQLSPQGDLPEWIRSLLVLRADLGDKERAAAYEDGARELARSGCTSVADIDSCGLASSGSGRRYLRVVTYTEALDIGDAGRRASVLEALRGRAGVEALSPHAPYSSSPALMRGIAQIARDQNLAVGIHWAETEAEGEWMEEGHGTFAGLVGSGLPSPKRPGLELIRESGLLNQNLSLYHANHPTPHEVELVREAGASVVHCPGAHTFFKRDAFPLEDWREAGVNLALGTDSLAGNEALDMLRELRLLRETFPELPAAECFAMATENGARAIGLGEQAGHLGAGAWADFASFQTTARGLERVLEAVTTGAVEPCGTWIGGDAVNLEGEA